MLKSELLKVLESQLVMTKKTTRRDVIALVRDMVEYHIQDNAEVRGITLSRSCIGVNLGEVMEIIAKSLFNNKLEKNTSNKHYDLLANGKKVEVKFTTSDAYAHPIDNNEVVDYYLIIAYSKKDGGNVFKVPYAQKDLIRVNAQGRIYTNQQAKFLDSRLTKKVFAF